MAHLSSEERREAHRAQLCQLTDMRDNLERAKDYCYLSKAELKQHVQILPALDIDSDDSCDSERRFFTPAASPKDPGKAAELLALGHDKWPGPCQQNCFPWHEAAYVAYWFSRQAYKAQQGLLPKSNWTGTELVTQPLSRLPLGTITNHLTSSHFSVLSDVDAMPSMTHKRLCHLSRYPSYEYKLCGAYVLPADSDQPHIAGLIADSTDPRHGSSSPADILRSEAHAAIALLRFQLRSQRLADHYTLPVLLFTMMHDKNARITQMYFDATAAKLVVRQSRILNLRPPTPLQMSPVPEPDAYLLLRWMACTPIGNTRLPLPRYDNDNNSSTKDSNVSSKKCFVFPNTMQWETNIA